jgi:hypothetical protein
MSRRIAFFVLTATSLLIAPPAQAGEHARPRIHAIPQHFAPAPHRGIKHLNAGRHGFIGRHRHSLAAPIEGIGGGFGAAAVAIAEASPALSTADGALAAYPTLRPDPQWQICQIGPYTDRYYECGPHSYHPFGAHGYRPNGTYGATRTAPDYVLAPNAKIIVIEHGK